MTAAQMWQIFVQDHPEREAQGYAAWQFGLSPDVADELLALVLRGIKTATASARAVFTMQDESVPRAGDLSIVLDGAGEARCVLRSTAVSTVPFSQVTARQAFLEGEGDRSLAYWQGVHRDYFIRELAMHGLTFDDTMAVVCEEFEVIWRPQA